MSNVESLRDYMDIPCFGEETISLVKALACPEGFRFSCGVGCTYTVDEKTFSQLRDNLAGYSESGLLEFDEGKSFCLCVQQGKNGLVHNAVHPVSPTSGVLHAKVYAMKFEPLKSGSPRYRVVVTSANLTAADELNITSVFDSEESEGSKTGTEFGSTVSGFFEKHFPDIVKGCKKECKPDTVKGCKEGCKISRLLCELKEVDFGVDGKVEFLDVSHNTVDGKVEFLDVSHNTLERIKDEAKDASDVICFSPFLSGGTVSQLKPQNGTLSLISRPDQMDLCKKYLDKLDKVTTYTLGVSDANNEEGVELPNALHAKLYRIYKPKDDETMTVINYLGSANATSAAFGQNIEALVRFEAVGAIENLKEPPYVRYDDPADDNGNQQQKEFESLCREIAGTFKWCESAYTVSASSKATQKIGAIELKLSGEELKLSRKEPEGEKGTCYTWLKPKKCRHCVTLCIVPKNNMMDLQPQTYTMLVDGDALPVDEQKLRDEITKRIIGDILSKAGESRAAETGGKTSSQGKTAGRKAAARRPGLTEALSGLRTAEQIRTAYSRALEILPHIDQERPRTVLERFVEDCEALLDDICPKKEEVRQGESAD